jgi:nucleoside-diphosphate-sugar epimerase
LTTRKKIILSGATGFVGQNLCAHLLKSGYEVHAIVRAGSNIEVFNYSSSKFHIYKFDGSLISLIEFFKKTGADCVIHLASNFIAEHKNTDVSGLIESNIVFGTFLLEAMLASGTKNFINTGTSWQHYHGNSYNPVCLYAATKQAFESLIEYYVQAEGFKVITLKLFDTYGETDTRPKLINLLHKFADERTELKMSAGEQELSLVHIEDVNNGYMIAMKRLFETEGYTNEDYAIKAKRSYKLKEVILIFEEITNKKVNVIWGGRPYRKREVMEVWDTNKLLPNWDPKISLYEGLKKY